MREFIAAADDRWISLLQDMRHDFYHYPCYAQAESELHNGKALAFYYESESSKLLIPLVRREILGLLANGSRLYDAITPYGYSGPIYTGDIQCEDLHRALLAYVENGRQHGFVTSFFRLHPLLNEKLVTVLAGDERVRLMHHGSTVSINLEYDIGFLDKVLRKNHRRDINKIRKSGFMIRLNHWDDFTEFQHMYAQTMARLNAVDYYYFSESYFQKLKSCFDKHLQLCTVISPDGNIAAGGLFTRVGDIVQYHLGGTNEHYLSHAPSKLMFFEMRNWAKESGARVFHLGGGLSADRDSLFDFKRGFGTDEHSFYTIRIIHDLETYKRLNSRFLAKNCQNVFQDPDFFPLYRTRLDRQRV